MFRRIGNYRLPYSYVMALLGVIFAHKPLLLPGIALVLLGVFTRFWSAGHIVKSDKLSDTGPYAFTRNPLYLGSFFSGLGIFVLVHNWWLLGIFVLGFALFYGDTIRSEEEYLGGKFGEDFERYKRNVPVFFPRLWPHKSDDESHFSWQQVIRNKEHKYFLSSVLVLGLIFLVAYLR